MLASDGTKIEEDDYLRMIEPHTRLMVLQDEELWIPKATEVMNAPDQVSEFFVNKTLKPVLSS